MFNMELYVKTIDLYGTSNKLFIAVKTSKATKIYIGMRICLILQLCCHFRYQLTDCLTGSTKDDNVVAVICVFVYLHTSVRFCG